MKLLTLNTHSLQETNMAQKQDLFCAWIENEQPDIIALQEVNQNMDAPAADDLACALVWKPEQAILREDNHGLALARRLVKAGLHYEWAWLPMKIGYDRYDEGLAIFSRKKILKTENLLASKIDTYTDFRTRRILGVQTEDGWFYSIHLSWWNDPHEPFALQWQRLLPQLEKHSKDSPVYLLGDFNSDAFLPGESADLVRQSGYFDTYVLAKKKDAGYTVGGVIDGWENQPQSGPKRIDQIWAGHKENVTESRVVFNGEKEPVLSDHYGLLVEIDDSRGAHE